MSSSKKKSIFLIFQDKRIQLHHKDGSVLQIKRQKIVYVSPKGLKNILSIQQIHRSPDLCCKINEAFILFNMYSNQHTYNDVYFQSKKPALNIQQLKKQQMKMSFKIYQFKWENPEVQETADGYRIFSDCKHASLTLHKNLYTIQINYLQYIRSDNTYIQKIPNMTKLLLQKYNYSYTQFPKMNLQKQNPEHFYKESKKILNIFSINKEWKYPLHLIWNSLITHQIIPHQFCYVEYSKNQLSLKTPMPSIRVIQNIFNNEEDKSGQKQKEIASLPILGKINHKDKCLFLKIEESLAWFDKQASFLYDGYGFWFYNNNSVNYRTVNKMQYDRQFHPKALPYTLRLKNEPQRSILDEMKLFINYLLQNRKISELNDIQVKFERTSSKFDNQNNLVKEQFNPDIGEFKAYSNGTIIAKFADRSLLTLSSKKMQAKIIRKNGDTCLVDLTNAECINYQNNKQYISWAIDFQERVFFMDEWIHKQERNNDIEQLLLNIQTMQKTSLTYLKL